MGLFRFVFLGHALVVAVAAVVAAAVESVTNCRVVKSMDHRHQFDRIGPDQFKSSSVKSPSSQVQTRRALLRNGNLSGL